jgi:hypothetical protein
MQTSLMGVIMSSILFRRFEGFLKQHSHESLSALEQELFDELFPLFQGDDSAAKAAEAAKKSPMLGLFGRFIQVEAGDRRMRRFSGRSLPRSRYYAVARNADGNDNQTLAHELRAYRDPVKYGMVEVIDAADGMNLVLEHDCVRLAPEHAFAVLIHNPHLLADKFKALSFKVLPEINGKRPWMYRFPYKVHRRSIERTIDLRFPQVRDWFFDFFRVPSEQSDSAPVKKWSDRTVAHSRFDLRDGTAPVPDSFWRMLPTLMNPDLGGGRALTGTSLQRVANWMRQRRVGAFIYPSARCDATAVLRNDALYEFYGWNLVDYENIEPPNPPAKFITFDPNPWPWLRFEPGVTLAVAPDGEMAGSFQVDGVVNYWAEDYIENIKALEAARAQHGECRNSRAEALWLGVLCQRWFRLALDEATRPSASDRLRELRGLGLLFGIPQVIGRFDELAGRSKDGKKDFAAMYAGSSKITERAAHALGETNNALEKLVLFGADFELFLLTLIGHRFTGREFSGRMLRKAARMPAVHMKGLFEADIAQRLTGFLAEAPDRIARDHATAAGEVAKGESLLRDAYQSLRR